ncbi:porin OmpA [Kluyvera sp. EC_51]|uniref:porin OmpA n=1 Tax=Kluyvera sp. EC_51 TaxID=2584089 RepID=UPI001C706A19|nr:porin OmpA [Kluyvera sp. EC_51]MBW9461474.1 porin OmpA [Kluyvera sp. EC_51]
MKKALITLIIANALTASTAFAAADAGTWYTGGKFGWSHYSDTSTNQQTNADGNKFGDVGKNSDNVGGGVFTGYQITPWLAVEGGYDYLGNMQFNGRNGASGSQMKSQGLQLSLKASYGLTDSWDLYGRAGAMGYRAESDIKGHNRFDTGVRPVVAVGTEYAFNKNWAGRLEYQWVSNVGNENQIGVSSDVHSVTAGLSYRFGQQDDAAVVAAPAAAVVAAPQPQRFNLKSDVMFGYDSAALTAEGKAAIAQLYHNPGMQPANDKTTVVIGYSDRTGAANYNQQLSAQRAQAVADELVALGMPAGNITAEGHGVSDSVTGASCDGQSGQQLINCLAPDRHVVVEITDKQ